MSIDTSPSPGTASVPAVSGAVRRASWGGVVALMLGVFALVTSEFLPASLLSPIAAGLGISEGTAGQAVTATALIGVVAGPAIGPLVPRLDRRILLVSLAVLAAVSNILVAVAPQFWLLLVARVLLGIAISGFWSMAVAVAAQLVPQEHLGRAMMIVNTGVSLATVVAVPLGAFLGAVWGWRAVFILVAAMSVAAAVAQLLLLPKIAPASGSGVRTLFAVLRSPVMIVGLLGMALLAGGHFAGFTYIRLGAADIPGLTAAGLAVLLAAYGLGAFAGNIVAGIVADRRLRTALVVMPAVLGGAVTVFALLPDQVPLAFAAVVLWGFAFGGVPTLVQTWAARTEPERMEAAGGLVVAAFQLAIALGAAVGGLLVDGAGVKEALVAGGIVAVLGGVLLGTARRRGPAA
ncbi:MFS transporter [Leifsonia sp. NPDC077715]|uniref:MFS transporter n=1 Tax=Leifsonia sp. NPDC077715 TaxID=3155539 RepID=UPI00341CD73F